MALTQKELERELQALLTQREQLKNNYMQVNGAVEALEQLVKLSKKKRAEGEAVMQAAAEELEEVAEQAENNES